MTDHVIIKISVENFNPILSSFFKWPPTALLDSVPDTEEKDTKFNESKSATCLKQRPERAASWSHCLQKVYISNSHYRGTFNQQWIWLNAKQ